MNQRISLGWPEFKDFDLDRELIAWQEGKGGWPLGQQAFICPWCLTRWAHTFIPQKESYRLEPVSCLSCSRPTVSHPIPGSLLDISGAGAIDYVLLNAMPPELVRREFELHLRIL